MARHHRNARETRVLPEIMSLRHAENFLRAIVDLA
jgi:hypothetical protein